MDSIALKANKIFSEKGKQPSGLLKVFDLPALAEKMKQSAAWLNGELTSKVLMKNPVKQMVLATLHAGTVISSFQSRKSITYQVVEGKIRFRSHRRTVILNKGQSFTLCENIKYNLTIREESVLLMILDKSL